MSALARIITIIGVTVLAATGCEEPIHRAPTDEHRNSKLTLEPTFESVKKVILQPKCLRCHGPGGEAARTPLRTREDLLDSPLEIVIPGNPEESGLILVLQEGARKKMPPPKSAIPPVSSEEIDIIAQWILNGAID